MEHSDHALALVELADELELPGLRERDLGLGLVTRLDLLVDHLVGDRERVRVVPLVLQLELDLLAGPAATGYRSAVN